MKKTISAESSVGIDGLISAVQKMAGQNLRFTTATCVDLKDQIEIIYHFEDDAFNLTNIRLHAKKGVEIPSISQIYLAATLIENEINDQFDVHFTGSAIDFDRRLLTTSDSPQMELNKYTTDIRITTAQACATKQQARKKGKCQDACPAGINVPRYVRLISQKKYKEALETIYKRNPLPAICGRVCFAGCEINCRQSIQDEAVMIRLLKRFVTDKAGIGIPKSTAPKTGKKVAIIGSGPAGLVAAFHLARKGHGVTIFEELPQTGGYMRTGIPEYRLPRKILDQEINIIKDQGVEIKVNQRIEDVDALTKQGFNAVMVATGAQKNSPMGIPGEELPGVYNCIQYLRDVNLGKKVDLGNKVLVVGGGNSAIDAARVALRHGSKEVIMLYRRTQKEMPASQKEIHEATEEGIKLEILCAPTKVERKNNKIAVTCIRMKLGAPDASGRAKPEPVPGSEFVIEADAIIAAIGQLAEVPPNLGVQLGKWGKYEKVTKPGVFAAGDLVSGPASVVEAIKTAREAASQIDKYLGGNGVVMEEDDCANTEFVKRIEMEDKDGKSQPNPCMSAERRRCNFDEVELGLTEEMALKEASRCWRCDWTEC